MYETGIRFGRPRNGNSISGTGTDYALPGKVQIISRVHPDSYRMGTGYFSGYFSPGLKRPGDETDHSLPPSAKVTSLLIYTSKSRRFSLKGVQLNLGRGRNFTSCYSFKLFLKNQFEYYPPISSLPRFCKHFSSLRFVQQTLIISHQLIIGTCPTFGLRRYFRDG